MAASAGQKHTDTLIHQHLEASLGEMMISRQCPVDATRLHRDKRGAIGERPFLVGTLGVERASLLKQLAADGHNFNVILISEQFQKSCKYRTVPWLTQSIADFRQYESSVVTSGATGSRCNARAQACHWSSGLSSAKK